MQHCRWADLLSGNYFGYCWFRVLNYKCCRQPMHMPDLPGQLIAFITLHTGRQHLPHQRQATKYFNCRRIQATALCMENMDSIPATNICANLPHKHLLFVSSGDQSFPCNTDDKLSQNGCYWATITSWYCEASFGGLLLVNFYIQVTPHSNYCMHARHTSPVRGNFHFDSVTPIIVKLDSLEFKARSLAAFCF